MAGPLGPDRTDLEAEALAWTRGSWVASAVYGANDGLGAVFGIVSGRGRRHKPISSITFLISGLAGMLASTFRWGWCLPRRESEAEVYRRKFH
jgi:hypothetical protein